MNILIVRLGALGDIVHAIPAAAALRAAFPDARIDWLVDAKHRAIVDLVTAIDRVRAARGADDPRLGRRRPARARPRYDIAIDLQGLMKSAVLARASGAARVVGFSIWHLREKSARPFYSETDDAAADEGGHVIQKNLRLLRVVGVETDASSFRLPTWRRRRSTRCGGSSGRAPFALLNPGAAWPNKRWPPARFGEVAAFLRDVRGLPSVVLWGPGEEALAHAVVASSNGAASVRAADRRRRSRGAVAAAALVVSGDTGPLHIAAAVGTPIVGALRPDRSAAERSVGARRCGGVAVRRLRLPLRAAVPRGGVVPREHRRRRGDGRDSAAPRPQLVGTAA